VAAPYPEYLISGKENALYSLYTYLLNYFGNITFPSPYKAPVISLSGFEQVKGAPSILIEDLGAPAKGLQVLGQYAGSGKIYVTEGTLVRIILEDRNLPEDTVPYTTAENEVRRLRDLLRYGLCSPGIVIYDQNGNATPLLTGISLIDQFNGNADTGSKVWMPFNEPGHWNETFIANQEDAPDWKQYKITCRINWIWYQGKEGF
jgi:hypothetical protein